MVADRADVERWQFWIDRGGTFTDCLGRDPAGCIHTAKLLSGDDAPLAGVRALRQYLALPPPAAGAAAEAAASTSTGGEAPAKEAAGAGDEVREFSDDGGLGLDETCS